MDIEKSHSFQQRRVNLDEKIEEGGLEMAPAPTIGSTNKDHDGCAHEPDTLARTWQTGKRKRFPKCSALALLLVLLCCAALIVIIILSDGNDYDTWSVKRYHYKGLRKPNSKEHLIKPRDLTFQVTVAQWISIIMFVAGKLLAVAFVEALTIYWWVAAMKGNTLKRLHVDYEAGRSLMTILYNFKMFNWLFFCSVTFTIFGVAGPLLQKASAIRMEIGVWTSTTESSYVWSHLQHSYWTPLATQFPTFALHPGTNRSKTSSDAITGYSRQANIVTNVTNCPRSQQNRPVSICGGWFKTIGFDIDCGDIEVVDIRTDGDTTKYFEIAFDHEDMFWDFNISVYWKNVSDCNPTFALERKCSFKPALVYLPINFEMADPDNTDSWHSAIHDVLISEESKRGGNRLRVGNFSESNASPEDYQFFSKASLMTHVFETYHLPKEATKTVAMYMDDGEGPYPYRSYRVAKLFPKPENPRATMISLYSAFDSLFTTSATVPTTTGITGNISVNGTFYSTDIYTEYNNNSCENHIAQEITFDVIDAIQDVTLRYSMLSAISGEDDESIGWVKSQGDNSTFRDIYHYTRNIYVSNYPILGGSIFIMLLAVACTASLFRGYWSLGRQVSLSPLEMARALYIARDPELPIAPGQASNAKVEDLVGVLGDFRVKYGEVGSKRIGMGLYEDVDHPKPGKLYH